MTLITNATDQRLVIFPDSGPESADPGESIDVPDDQAAGYVESGMWSLASPAKGAAKAKSPVGDHSDPEPESPTPPSADNTKEG